MSDRILRKIRQRATWQSGLRTAGAAPLGCRGVNHCRGLRLHRQCDLRIKTGFAVGFRLTRRRAAVQKAVRSIVGALIEPVLTTPNRKSPLLQEFVVHLPED